MLAKIIATILIGINAYIGIRFLLNVLNVLQTSKYGKTATAVYAVLFLSLTILAAWLFFIKHLVKYSIYAGIGVWVIIIAGLFISLITENHQ